LIAVASTPVELPANTVVIVSEVPRRRGTITKVEFHHALAQAAALAGRESTPEPGKGGYGKLKEVALGELLDMVWVRGQAAEMGIAVTHGKITRELVRLKKQAFKGEAEYHRFLKEAHYTRRDVRERVERQLLSTAIQRRVIGKVGEGASGQKAFSEFIEAYAERWRARTVCAPEYMLASRCSNAPSSSRSSA
jgi:hypothetical protein